MRHAAVVLLLCGGCTFDGSGVAADDGGTTITDPDADVSASADAGHPDSRPIAPDASADGCLSHQMMCGMACRNVTADPHHCGGCGLKCNDDEYCSGSACVCRPGLVRRQGSDRCIDPNSDPDACGPTQQSCNGSDDRCQDGQCVEECDEDNFTECSKACVDTDTNPLHCGSCGKKCKDHEICFGGACLSYDAEPVCNGCPCGDCTDGEQCSQYPGDSSLTICVQN